MDALIKYTFVLLIISNVICRNAKYDIWKRWSMQNPRIKRQEGYIYDKPSVAFDLPVSSSTAGTQPPVTGRTQSQYMYYAYPAPTDGGRGGSNVGYSTNAGSVVTTSTNTPGSSGFPTPASDVVITPATFSASGYDYETSKNVASTVSANEGISSTSGVTGYAYTAPSSTTGIQTSCTPGYDCNTSTATGNPTSSISTVSTNAPKYLPPTPSSNVLNDEGVSINNIPSNPNTSGTPIGSSTPRSAVDTNYLPPNIPQFPVSTATGSATSSGTGIQQVTSNGYLPPVSTPSSSSLAVSTPASTYLPPVFK